MRIVSAINMSDIFVYYFYSHGVHLLEYTYMAYFSWLAMESEIKLNK